MSIVLSDDPEYNFFSGQTMVANFLLLSQVMVQYFDEVFFFNSLCSFCFSLDTTAISRNEDVCNGTQSQKQFIKKITQIAFQKIRVFFCVCVSGTNGRLGCVVYYTTLLKICCCLLCIMALCGKIVYTDFI